MSDEITKEPVVESKVTEELAPEELAGVNGGGSAQTTAGQATKKGGDAPVKYLNVTMTETFISKM